MVSSKSKWNYVLFFLLGFLIAMLFYPSQNISEVGKSIADSKILSGSTNIVAVTSQGEGTIGKVEVDILNGEGKVLMNTNPFLEPDTQYSANIAVDVAENITNVNLKNKNVIFNFDINGTVLGGPSAGAAMTLATIAAVEDKPIKDIAITGIILPNGLVGQIGGIFEKAQAANTNGIKIFLVPKGQSIFTYYEKEITKKEIGAGFTIYNTRYVPKSVDLNEYFKDKGMEVIEVNNINEAVNYAF